MILNIKFNNISPELASQKEYELIVIGSGFGASFFLHEAIKHVKGPILVLEWGEYHPWQWHLENKRHTDLTDADTFTNETEKAWNTTVAFGGGTNCWYAQTPRIHPSDFQLATKYGVGRDWPISYEELEPFYCEAEELMSISGDPDMARVLPRSKPFPQPPHIGSSIDRAMKQAMPDQHFIMPTGRARIATPQRPACCASLNCHLCPVQAKFTAHNGFSELYQRSQIDICFNAEVKTLESSSQSITGVTFASNDRQFTVKGDTVVLGANAIQSPAILLRSGLDQGDVGKGLHEQVGMGVEVFLKGMKNFDGSTITTGLNYAFSDGDFRKESAASLLYFENRWSYGFRKDMNRLAETLPMIIMAEDLPQSENYVGIDPVTGKATIHYTQESDYAFKGIEHAFSRLEKVLAPLPVESIHKRGKRATESHVQGTLRMGQKNDHSVVDSDQVHHHYRNLVIVGSSVFPSCSPANPSLTVAALSLKAARTFYGKEGSA